MFSILMSLLGLSLRTERNLLRFISLEVLDRYRSKRATNHAHLGRAGLSHGFARSVLGVWRPFKFMLLRVSGLRTQAMALELARRALYANWALIGLAFTVLIILMIQGDLTNRYVVSNSAIDLPVFFRITGSWAGSSGSLLFWYFLLTLFTAVVVMQTRKKLFNRLPVLFLSLGLLNFLFVLLCLFFQDAQPFRQFAVTMKSGRGINPLLLHWAMIIHPPILYVGYVSFAIPFAIAMSAVISGNLREDWLKLIRRWSIFAWFFLGVGILLGSKWAYEELGWGGYWAWDPVENASLMPFLLATAFLHSLIVQERRGMLRFWNILLITLAYHFCLLGTWITRSGVLQGPHTFAQSTIGTPFIIYIGISFTFFMRYLYFERHKLRPARRLEAVTSKEGSMLINNFLMALATLIVLIGVFSPLLPLDCGFAGGDGFSCRNVEWKQSTYNKIMVPLGIITLFLMGASPLLAWRKDAGSVYARNLRLPLIAGVIGGLVFAFTYRFFFTRGSGDSYSGAWGPPIISEIMAVLTVGVSIFTLFGLGLEYWRGTRSRVLRFGENYLLAFTRLVLRNKRRYAGYLVHLSIIFLFIGYAGAAFKETRKFSFHYYKVAQEPGTPSVRYFSNDKAYLQGYEIQARDLFLRPVFKENADRNNPVHFTVGQQAHYVIHRGTDRKPAAKQPPGTTAFAFANREAPLHARFLKFWFGIILDGRMITERQFHPQINPVSGGVQRDQNRVALRTPTSEPDIRSTWNEDIYIQLGALKDPVTGRNPNLTHLYEAYYFRGTRPSEYREFFPSALVGTLEIWINPLVKFIWLGSILFFVAGLIILVPLGERGLE